MSLRVNPDPLSDVLVDIARNRQQENALLLQISSGRRVSSPSDDPAAVAQFIRNRAQYETVAQFSRNVSTMQGVLAVADSALNTVVTALTRAISLGTQGANGTLTQSDRDAIAEELAGIKEEILGQANLSYQGNYVFAGTASGTKPFVADASQASGIRYAGNTSVNRVQITDGEDVATNVPGSQIFMASGADVFLGITHLITALQTNTDIEAALSEVESAFEQVNSARSFYGSTMTRLDAAASLLSTEMTELSQQETDLIGADMAYAASALVQTENGLNAALAAAGAITQLSLLDFLS